MELRFVKMHGLGNDFVVFEDLAEELDFDPEAIAWFCDRHFGVGGDGLILVRPATTPEADFYMAYYNGDGSVAEMCGNGVRCFAKYLVDRGLVTADRGEIVVSKLAPFFLHFATGSAAPGRICAIDHECLGLISWT